MDKSLRFTSYKLNKFQLHYLFLLCTGRNHLPITEYLLLILLFSVCYICIVINKYFDNILKYKAFDNNVLFLKCQILDTEYHKHKLKENKSKQNITKHHKTLYHCYDSVLSFCIRYFVMGWLGKLQICLVCWKKYLVASNMKIAIINKNWILLM